VKSFFELFAAVIGVVTVTVLAMSMCHEYGYFWSIGPQFQTLLTTSDYFANGVLWLPFTLLGAYIWIDWGRLKDQPKVPLDQKKWGTLAWFTAIVLLAGWTVVTSNWPPIQFMAAINIVVLAVIVWSWLWRRLAARVPSFEPPFDVAAKQLIRLGPPVLLLMFVYGSVDAGNDLTRKDQPYAFYLKDNTSPQLRIFLRNFDKGLLVRNAVNDALECYKWDSVVSITRHESNNHAV
jgi:hypothetical protein